MGCVGGGKRFIGTMISCGLKDNVDYVDTPNTLLK